MIRLAANLSMLFTELPFLERIGAAARAGFAAVECQFPYPHDASAIAHRLTEHRIPLVLHNLPAGNWEAGERGIACHPDRVDEFQAGVERAVEYATALGCTRVNCLAGLTPEGSERIAHETLVRNLREAAATLRAAGIALLIEAINTTDVPGFFLSTTSQALAVLNDVASDNLFLQYDAYHMHMMGERPADMIGRHADRIRHIQIADAPGRHEPGTGRLDHAGLLLAIDRAGYDGWIGCEYNPLHSTDEGLAWAAQHLRPRV